MNYFSPSFIFFCSFILLFFAFLPKKTRPLWLLLASFFWYFNWSTAWFISFISIIFINLLSASFISSLPQEKRKKFFYILIALNVLVLAAFKVLPAISEDFTTPYGSSFFMLILLGSIIDLNRNNDVLQKEEFISFALMPFFFPVLMAGPIEKKEHFFPQIKNLSDIRLVNLADGALIFGLGFYKKLFIGDPLSNNIIRDLYPNNILFLALLDIFTTNILFSSYCDMGRGIARMFGITLPVNFKPFYYSKNPIDFWKRWNITLSSWIRDYVTFPIMLKWGRKINPVLIIIFSSLLVGLWHGVSLNWLAFGFFNGLLIYFYTMINQRWSSKAMGILFAVILWLGNGLLQKSNFLELIQAPFTFMVHLNYDRIDLWSVGYALALLFIYEFYQEKKEDWDFITKWPLPVKYFFASALVAKFLFDLSMGRYVEFVELPPLYFTI